jgi:predicted nucleic acid-binding protein
MASRDRFGLSCWDAAIVEAAWLLGCEQSCPRISRTARTTTGMVVGNQLC